MPPQPRWTDENAGAVDATDRDIKLPAWCWALAIILVLITLYGLALLMASYARADPPQHMTHPEWHAWFESQHNLRGGSCCGLGDGHLVSDTDWGTAPNGSYWVRIDGQRHLVEHWQHMRPGDDNPTGSAIVWYARLYDGSLAIYCFAPGVMW